MRWLVSKLLIGFIASNITLILDYFFTYEKEEEDMENEYELVLTLDETFTDDDSCTCCGNARSTTDSDYCNKCFDSMNWLYIASQGMDNKEYIFDNPEFTKDLVNSKKVEKWKVLLELYNELSESDKKKFKYVI